ncbi:ferredoxin--NADP reductase [Natronoflexus pectinivorans]|uniref:Ferredoxin--NADP+ reductase n=1 Tax=Natronoflexus pectinivorans TaxID=682526 RepID=A0A4R2GLL2_9BACT|nr:FAD-binding oxidoreductase [Natronoflexus pectinivorans]TCO09885.1 ferredoxin--NADP+ reductase [Natronoflexus pectinivorans]
MPHTQRKKKNLYPSLVLGKKEIADGVFTIETEKKFSFIPGQVIALALNPEDEPRLYSIASGNEGKTLRILFDINPEGQLTPALSKCRIGDTVFVSEPFGKFIGTQEQAFWIATGTGIAPFISMLESGLAINKTLLHGARYISQFYFADKFEEAMHKNYLRFCTAEENNMVIHGRLTDYLKKQETLSPKIKYYLCGSAEMVVEVRDILINKGIPFNNIVAEIYF